MTERPEDLVLEHLRAIRADLATVRETQREHTAQLSRIELSLAGLQRDMAGLHADIATLHERLDRLGDRIERIEHRLGGETP